MRSWVLAACILAAFWTLSPRTVRAACGGDCDDAYSSDIDACHSQYGDDPADADDLADCIQNARDDYRSCLDDCTDADARPTTRLPSLALGGGQPVREGACWINVRTKVCALRHWDSVSPHHIYPVFCRFER